MFPDLKNEQEKNYLKKKTNAGDRQKVVFESMVVNNQNNKKPQNYKFKSEPEEPIYISNSPLNHNYKRYAEN